jgi:transposase
MFIRRKHTPNSSKTAVQLVDSVRHGKTVKQKIIRHFGYAMNEEEVTALVKIAHNYKESLQNKTAPVIFEKGDLLNTVIEQGGKSINQTSPLTVNLRDIKETKRICLGIHQSYGRVFDSIGFHKVVKTPSRKKYSIKLMRDIVMARIVKPMSKRSSAMMLEEEYGIKANLNSIYNMMDLLDDSAIEKIKALSYQYSKSLLDEKINIVFYDCTTLYFESFIEDDLKANGYSKDGKFNQSQVLLAIMVTPSGLPIGYELFQGDKFEGHTLDKALERLHQQYKIDQIIFVADAALLSADNILAFKEKNQPFIVGARIKNVNKQLTEKILDKEKYQPLIPHKDQQEQQDDHTYIDLIMEEEQMRMIVTYSSNRAAKDKHDRDKAIESLSKRIAKSKDPKSLINNFGYKKFIKIEGEATIHIDQDRIKEAEKWDGLHGIITNINDEKVQTLLAHYKGLWQVEETFRISKHDLRMRPIFHWTQKRIKSHIAICFMALVTIRVLEYKVKLQYKKLSPEVIRYELQKLQVSILHDQSTKKQYALPSQASQHAKKITQLLGYKWNDIPYPIKP